MAAAMGGLDALVFHGTVSDNLTWLTAKKTGSVQPLGYLLDGENIFASRCVLRRRWINFES